MGRFGLADDTPPGRDHLRVEPVPGQFTEQARKFDLRTAVHDHFDALLCCPLGGGGVSHPELHPYHRRAMIDGTVGDRPGRFGIAEDVDHVDGLGQALQIGIDQLAENFAASGAGINRVDPVSLGLKVLHREIRRPVPAGTCPDHRNGPHRCEDLLDIAVRIGVMVEEERLVGGRHTYSPVQCGLRFSMKALIPSSASSACMFRVITAPA